MILCNSTNSVYLSIVCVMAWRIQSTVASTANPDWNYTLYITALQSHLELWLGIIAANLPTLAPLFNKFIKPAIKSYLGSRGSKQPSAGGKRILRTFGSGDPTKRDKFNRLDDDSLDCPGESIERQNFSKVETCAPLSRCASSFAISMRRDFEVGVEVFDRPQKEAIQAHSPV